MSIHYAQWDSKLGMFHFAATDESLLAIGYDSNWPRIRASLADELVEEENPLIEFAIAQVEEYLAGDRRDFELPLEPRGTPFQKSVWRSLEKIPFGTTLTYGEQAVRLRKPSAVRAVGTANGRNPISIVIPCHRVVGSSGHLTGYAGGIDVKRRLLELEGFLSPSKG